MSVHHLPPRTALSQATHPLGDDIAVLRLIRSRRVGPATFHRLVAQYGSVEGALEALPQIAAQAGVTQYQPCSLQQAMAEMSAGQRLGARLVTCYAADYPAALRDIDTAPPALWVRGHPLWNQMDAIAVIGARNASSLGLRMARGMAAGLGDHGYVIVAGLARGVDTAAHDAALAKGTIAVMAGGVDVIYPSENSGLYHKIIENGAVISEHPPGTEPAARHFPTRNRIVSGLSRGVVVIEAAYRSGSLITARNALDQGREVMAVPGHPMDARAAGCNALIRDGATLVRSAADVIDAVSLSTDTTLTRKPATSAPPPVAARPDLGVKPATPPMVALSHDVIENRILAYLGPSPCDENDLIRDLGVPPAQANAAIVSLQLLGRITRLAGGRLARE